MLRSPFAPVVVPVVALVAALVRWWVQGSGNVYTALSKRFYVPDPDLGWRVSTQHPIWLGLEVCAVIAAIAVGLAVGGWIIRRREVKRGQRAKVLRIAAWVVAVLPLAVPIAAFASGPGPANARDTLPTEVVATKDGPGGVTPSDRGSLDAPGGRYEVVVHEGTAITAHLSAGGETFDARFTGGIRGSWQGDPHDLTKSIAAEVSVDAASVDTGIGERSAHARESYLQAEKYPRISVAIDKVIGAIATEPGMIGFRAQGTLSLIGKTHVVDITGTLKKPDAAALARLGLTGDILLAQADFSIVIKQTALAPDAGDFDGDRIPIHVSLVLRHTSG